MNDWEVIYQSPDTISYPNWWKGMRDWERSNRRLIFRNTRGGRPNKATMDLLQRVGEDSHPRTKLVVLAINEWDEILM
jgi:hypothetical protein